MSTLQKDELKVTNTIRFIEAAQDLIDQVGLEGLSIRKIAEKAGFHNSTIYLYFKDMDHLVMLATLKHFADYSKSLARLSRQDLPPLDNFFAVWSFFGHTAFRNPHIFYNFFFGKYSDNLTEIMGEYYSLFPDEKEEYSLLIETMYYGKNIRERCLNLLKSLLGCGIKVQEDTLELINDIIVACLRSLLKEKCQDPEGDPGAATNRLLEMIRYVTGA
nr:TetR/AcrR family transcriptional regulator [uncultured Merdimonas sp.]